MTVWEEKPHSTIYLKWLLIGASSFRLSALCCTRECNYVNRKWCMSRGRLNIKEPISDCSLAPSPFTHTADLDYETSTPNTQPHIEYLFSRSSDVPFESIATQNRRIHDLSIHRTRQRKNLKGSRFSIICYFNIWTSDFFPHLQIIIKHS